MPTGTDSWIEENSPLAFEKLHAMGVVQYRWNTAELYMVLLIAAVTNLNFDTAWKRTRKRRASQLFGMLRDGYRFLSKSPQVIEHVEHAISLYDVNLKNRSQVTHFLPEGGNSESLHNSRSSDYLAMFDQTPIKTDLLDLRRCADDLRLLNRYLVGISNALGDRPFLKMAGKVGPMPEKPALPSLLWAEDGPSNG